MYYLEPPTLGVSERSGATYMVWFGVCMSSFFLLIVLLLRDQLNSPCSCFFLQVLLASFLWCVGWCRLFLFDSPHVPLGLGCVQCVFARSRPLWKRFTLSSFALPKSLGSLGAPVDTPSRFWAACQAHVHQTEPSQQQTAAARDQRWFPKAADPAARAEASKSETAW